MKFKIVILGVVVMMCCVGYVMAEEMGSVKTEDSKKVMPEDKEAIVKYCPVCGPEEEMHGLALGYKYNETKYTFCSMGCLKAFKENPNQFIGEETSDASE